ncbi:SDR family oxidoreductase [Waddlia chondrophila]|uniref:Glucose-1-dehydrogenase n=1 Tax=Waddlia chondrophila (strain ATCC VR-1470 / WSU 86-1044) TaxID=716544 RepID=D6YUK3_WADCW|nr:SDR family oxidoreductase [Waddlia chondrophila]ADI37814.1 glucose-1-dehydrogenase [Waddlia chondrophila WSU 86-1044]
MENVQPEESLPDAAVPSCRIRKVLKGQKALVTGGDSGIGKGIALSLAQAGADIVVNYASNEAAAGETVEEIKQKNPEVQVFAHQTDVSDESQVQGMFKGMIKQFGAIDILVNNAGLQQDSPFHEMTLEKWNKVINVNLTGQFLCAREAVREFMRQGVKEKVSCSAGKIICISSVHEVIPWAGHVNYAASKGGIMMMMKSIAQEVARYKIRVNSICPGAIRTPINRSAWDTPEAYKSLMSLIPYNRIGEADDIGRAAVWLASDEADYVCGVSFFVDGGMTLYPGFTSGG